MMKSNPYTRIFLICLALLPLCGCGLIFQPRLVAGGDLSAVPRFDPADYGFSIDCVKIETGDPDEQGYVMEFNGDTIFRIRQSRPVKTKYAPFTKTATTQCRIGRRSYPVLFDTGNRVLPYITTTHILENELPIYAMTLTDDQQQSYDYGIAMIEALKIGKLKLVNLPAAYSTWHTGYHLFGLDIAPIGQDKQINISLSVMQEFRYIRFDSIKRRMVFSRDESFKPDEPDEWKTYPLLNRDNRLYIQSTLEGVPVTLMIDTGSEADLFLTRECFERLVALQPRLEKAWQAKGYVYAPLAGGRYPAQARFVWGLTFDGCRYKLLTVAAVGQEGRIYDFLNEHGFDGLLGFPFFDETVMVLDFEHQTLWAKKEAWSRFEH